MITFGSKLAPHNNNYTAVQAKPSLKAALATDVFFGQGKTIDRDKIAAAFHAVLDETQGIDNQPESARLKDDSGLDSLAFLDFKIELEKRLFPPEALGKGAVAELSDYVIEREDIITIHEWIQLLADPRLASRIKPEYLKA